MSNRFSIRSQILWGIALMVGLGMALALTSLAKAGGRAVHPVNDAPNPAPSKYYVAKTGNGSDGMTWPTSYTTVQDALMSSFSGDQIWVATGVYTPGDSQTDSFNLKPGVELYGGFTFGDSQFSDRDWINNPTVLSGDIDGNDITDEHGVVISTTNINLFNAYHVLTAKNVTETSVLDGFWITAGRASAIFPNSSGGGLYCDGSGVGNFCGPPQAPGVFGE